MCERRGGVGCVKECGRCPFAEITLPKPVSSSNALDTKRTSPELSVTEGPVTKGPALDLLRDSSLPRLAAVAKGELQPE